MSILIILPNNLVIIVDKIYNKTNNQVQRLLGKLHCSVFKAKDIKKAVFTYDEMTKTFT